MDYKKNLEIEYQDMLAELKAKSKASQLKVAMAANGEMITFYWDTGKMISEATKGEKSDRSFIFKLNGDMAKEFEGIENFSKENLADMLTFYKFYAHQFSKDDQPVVELDEAQKGFIENCHQLVVQIPWSYNLLIISKVKTVYEAIYYINEVMYKDWELPDLEFYIRANLYKRSGKPAADFKNVDRDINSTLVKNTFTDAGVTDFIALKTKGTIRDTAKFTS